VHHNENIHIKLAVVLRTILYSFLVVAVCYVDVCDKEWFVSSTEVITASVTTSRTSSQLDTAIDRSLEKDSDSNNIPGM